MLVDDAAFMRLNLKNILKVVEDISICEAENGVDALEKLPQHNPDLIILDITMPEMDGIECLKGIRKFNPNCKVLMCSAMGQQAKVAESIQNGANDFIVKPFDNDKFVEKVKRLLE